ncbi:MAG: glycosyltransferase [Candidatus Paceibacterota bacterium]|jgi:glycosyltransferase involved in cell wall biosynthesis
MKIAVFHNFLDNIGGAEIVTLTLARELEADVYTTNINKEKIERMGFGDVSPRIFSIGKIPVNAPWRQQAAFYKFRKLDLSKRYDFFVISGDWAMSGAVKNKPNLWYVHSPLNELWAFKPFIRKNLLTFFQRPAYDIWTYFMRKLSLRYAEHVELFVANSQNTKNRLKKFYEKDSTVIHPPTDTNSYRYEDSEGYWLSVNRLIPHKRIEIQLDAFRNMPEEKLIIVGSFEAGAKQFEETKKKIAESLPQNVTLIHFAEKEKLRDLYARSKGVITTSMDEDFGMSVIEAFASGKPVIAPDEGGYKETVEHNVNGILIENIDGEKLREAIIEINKKDPSLYRDRNILKAKDFDTRAFIQKIRTMIEK